MQIEIGRSLVTGPAGQIAFPLAARLAKDNEVFGVARSATPDAGAMRGGGHPTAVGRSPDLRLRFEGAGCRSTTRCIWRP
ncbi:MAG: hypothetical protein R3E53_21565 [Myxococcota bacterium]